LPAPFVAGARILARESVGQPHLAASGFQIARMQPPHPAKVDLKRLHEIFRQHCDAILPALAVPHHDLAIGEVDILNTHHQTFLQPQTRAVEQAHHQPLETVELNEQTAEPRLRTAPPGAAPAASHALDRRTTEARAQERACTRTTTRSAPDS